MRAIPLVTAWFVTPEQLALELSRPDSERTFSAYPYSGDQGIPLKAQTWGMRHDVLIDIARSYKLPGQDPAQHRKIAWRKLLEELPPGTYVWRDEFERWYASAYYSPDSVWEEEHRVIGEDDDPGPVFHWKQRDATLDLSAVALRNFEALIFEGFDLQMATASGPTQSATVAVDDAEEKDSSPAAQDATSVSAPAMQSDLDKLSAPLTPASGKRWTPQRLADLEAWRKTLGTKGVAAKFGISTQYVRRLLPGEKPNPSANNPFGLRKK